MREIKKLFNHSASYFFGHVAALLAGFISFPIFTRLFSVEEYGALNLINTTIIFMIAIGKCGINKGVGRFFLEFKTNEKTGGEETFFSTVVLGVFVTAGFLCFCVILGANILGNYFKDLVFFKLIFFVVIIVWLRSVTTVFLSFLNVEQRPKEYIIFNSIKRYASVLFSVVLVLSLLDRLKGYFFGIAIAEFCVFFLLLEKYRKLVVISKFDRGFLKKLLWFGMPLVFAEFAGIVLTYGDRFLVQMYLGGYKLGIYSAAYNLSSYFSQLMLVPLGLAVFPIYMKIWNEEGKKKTVLFLEKCWEYYLMIALPLFFLVFAVNKNLILLLASSKYVSAGPILMLILVGLLLNGAFDILGAGLLIGKKTIIISLFTILAGVLNIVLNVLMIPKFGLSGAAVATIIAYLIFIGFTSFYSFKIIRIKVFKKGLIIYFFAAIVMSFCMNLFTHKNMLVEMGGKVFIGLSVYAITLFLLKTSLSHYEKLDK